MSNCRASAPKSLIHNGHPRADDLRKRMPALATLAFASISSVCSAGCLPSERGICSPTINADGLVGQTSYSTLPFASAIYAQSWAASPSLSPANLFWNYGTNFTNPQTMANARASAQDMTARGIVPSSGAQRWEDTYEASQPAALFGAEPGWLVDDRQSLDLLNKPDFQAWVKWQKAHANLFMIAADGGSVGADFRPWRGTWGHISPIMPLPAADWPSDVRNATYGDWYAYRWGQTARLSGAYGIMLSDFEDSQPVFPTYQIGFNPEKIAKFELATGQTVPGASIAQQAAYINSHFTSAWNDFLGTAVAQFYKALAWRLTSDSGQQALVIDQCGGWASELRFYEIDKSIILNVMGPDQYICIWDDQTMQVGRSGQPMIWGIGGMVIAAAREPDIRDGGNLSADDPAFWQAAATFWSDLSPADQKERGLKELKRVWLETAWSHIATRQGTTRRALSFMSRDYWDVGNLDPVVQQLIQTVIPTSPFGFALYYSLEAERRREPQIPIAQNLNLAYMNPAFLVSFKNSGGVVNYYVSGNALPALKASARPAAWIVLDGPLTTAELTKLKAVAPVLQTVAEAKAFANAPLAFSADLTGTGFYDQTHRLIVTVTNLEARQIIGTMTLKTLKAGKYVATDLFTNAKITFSVVGGKASVPLTLARWDTRAFAVTAM